MAPTGIRRKTRQKDVKGLNPQSPGRGPQGLLFVVTSGPQAPGRRGCADGCSASPARLPPRTAEASQPAPNSRITYNRGSLWDVGLADPLCSSVAQRLA